MEKVTMKPSHIVTIGISLALLWILIRSVHYLYVAPIQNAYWWSGDETWLMSQYNEFLTTGHYINPNAPGSAYARCTGMLFGSCYLTAAIYGIPALLLKFPTIDVGRTITFALSLAMLLTIWLLAKRYGLPPWLRMFSCILLASTLGFFVMSHTARYDLLVGFGVLACVAILPLALERYADLSIALGLLFPLCLLLNGHLLIYLFLVLVYFALISKANWKMLGISMIGGFALLFALQLLLLHSWSFFGPLEKKGLNQIPFTMLLHPKSDWANIFWRYYIASMWARNIIFLSVALVLALGIVMIRHKGKFPGVLSITEKRLAIGATLAVLASVFLEDDVTPRYFIHLLPTIVFVFTLSLFTLYRLSSVKLLVASIALLIGVFSLYDYAQATDTMGTVGETISSENASAIRAALAAIHARSKNKIPRVFCTVAGQSIAMDDDSCMLFTTVMYNQPAPAVPDSTIWQQAHIDYAIKYTGNWDEINSYIDTASHPKIIFERTGHFADFARSYDPAGFRALDTLRVYEYR